MPGGHAASACPYTTNAAFVASQQPSAPVPAAARPPETSPQTRTTSQHRTITQPRLRRSPGVLTGLDELGPQVPSEFFKTLLLARYANLEEGDAEQVETAFHEWVRCHRDRLGLTRRGNDACLVSKKFSSMRRTECPPSSC